MTHGFKRWQLSIHQALMAFVLYTQMLRNLQRSYILINPFLLKIPEVEDVSNAIL